VSRERTRRRRLARLLREWVEEEEDEVEAEEEW
jgi:hypothetical protein